MSLTANGELIPEGGGDNIPLIREALTLGRRESCDICLKVPNVSGLHCELNFKDGFWWIKDLNSTNGVKVNGTRVPRKLLHPGDRITIAKKTWTIEYQLPSGKRAMEEVMEDMEDEDILNQPLLERAGLVKPQARTTNKLPPKQQQKQANNASRPASNEFDPAQFLLGDGEDM